MGEPTRTDDYRAGWRAGVEAAALRSIECGHIRTADAIRNLQPPEAPVGECKGSFAQPERHPPLTQDQRTELAKWLECKPDEVVERMTSIRKGEAEIRAGRGIPLEYLEREFEKDAELQRLREQHAEAMKMLEQAFGLIQGVDGRHAGVTGTQKEPWKEDAYNWLKKYAALLQREPKARGEGEGA